jgi:hypothetical protein
MDLIASLRSQAAALPDGPYTAGIEAVLLHLDAAFRHRQRGVENDDETFFTDAIYRSNQAFEGSVKEAYRVLAGKDPSHKRPFDIESYLESNDIFTARVLKQFTNYRTEWRNPSTHDYKLKFDQSESLLAIVTVAAFASMLIDQISEKLAFDASQREVRSNPTQADQTLEPIRNKAVREKVSALIQEFCLNHYPTPIEGKLVTERQLMGALHGFLVSMIPELTVATDVRLEGYRHPCPDWVIADQSERVVVEFRLTRIREVMAHGNALSLVGTYMEATGIRSGILVYLPTARATLEAEEITFKNAERTMGGMITVLSAPPGRSDARDSSDG